VMFCQASVGNFFRDKNEGPRSTGQGHSTIGIRIHTTRISVFKTCLQPVCKKDKLSEEMKTSLYETMLYAFGTKI
jgi:hypothetical protein